MNRPGSYRKQMMWSTAILLAALAAGCQGTRDPILGGNDSAVLVVAGPQVTLTAPATTIPGPTAGAPTNTLITAAFTEPMNPATIPGSFTLAGPGGAPVAGVASYASGTAIFTPGSILTADTTYTATITLAATNPAGKPLAGNQAPLPGPSNFVWSFTTGAGPDLVRPQVNVTVPATTIPGPTLGSATNTAISATFTKPLNPATVTAASFTLTGPGVTPVAGAVSYASSTAVFTPTAALAASTTYTATLTTAVTDLSSNQLAGNQGSLPAASNYVWTFTTGLSSNTTRPQVTLTVPATTIPGPTSGIATNTAITATFTQDMAPATINAASFTLTTPLPGVSPMGSVTYSGSSRTAIFKPLAVLAANTTYTATITTAATDLAGNQLAGNKAPLPAASKYVWTFTTGSALAVAPKITLTSPANLVTGVALNAAVSATFSEAMDPSTLSTATFTVETGGVPITGAVTYDPAANIATFTPTSNLTASTSYTATLTGATDLAGDALVAGPVPNPWIFTTGVALGTGSINLGSASTFGIMASAAITSTGNSVINGNVALQPGTSMTGFPPGVVNGNIDVNDAASALAYTDLLTAYTSAKGLPPGFPISGGADLGALYPTGIAPGTYTSGSTMLVSTPLVLDAGGNANAVWVFQIGSALTTGASVSLANGAQAKNVFWVPTSSATIGVGTTFYGTILAGVSVTGNTGATINGRILAGAVGAGAVALQDTTVNVPAS